MAGAFLTVDPPPEIHQRLLPPEAIWENQQSLGDSVGVGGMSSAQSLHCEPIGYQGTKLGKNCGFR